MKTRIIGIMLLALACMSCDTIQWEATKPELSSPVVKTLQPSNIMPLSVTLNMRINDEGSFRNAQYGFKYGKSKSSLYDTATLQKAFGSSNASQTINNLEAATTYYYCAYATNAVGTHYGDTLSFSTLSGEMTLSIQMSPYYGGKYVACTASVQHVLLPVTDYGFGILAEGERQERIVSLKQQQTADFSYIKPLDILNNGKKYKVRAYAKNAVGTYYSQEVKFTSSTSRNNVECIDLGLSHLWATKNIGASDYSDSGLYYTWGETAVKTNFSYVSLLWKDAPSSSIITNNVLNTQKDVAHSLYVSNWQIPSQADIDELLQQCTWEWTTISSCNGYLVTGRTGSSIFLPAAGYKVESTLQGYSTTGYYFSTQCNIVSWPYITLYGLRFNDKKRTATWFDAFYAGYVVRPIVSE